MPELSRFGALNYLRTCFIECIQCSLNLSSHENTIQKKEYGGGLHHDFESVCFFVHITDSYSFLLNRRHVVIVDTSNFSVLLLNCLVANPNMIQPGTAQDL